MIKIISALDTFLVRKPVLRPNKNIDSCRFVGDDLKTTIHFGYYNDEKIVGVASLFELKNINFDVINQYQLRGMAVLNDYQKLGIGEKLMNYCENHSVKKNINLIWFNARISAVPFYEKLGYQKFGNLFIIPEIGDHLVMFKLFVDNK